MSGAFTSPGPKAPCIMAGSDESPQQARAVNLQGNKRMRNVKNTLHRRTSVSITDTDAPQTPPPGEASPEPASDLTAELDAVLHRPWHSLRSFFVRELGWGLVRHRGG